MKIRICFSLIITCISVIVFGQRMSSALETQFKSNEIVDCIIVMEDQLDLYGKTEGWTKNQKANYVYDQLYRHAHQSQKHLAYYLDQNKIDHQSFFVFNGFRAHLSMEQANEIMELFNVEKIVYNVPTRMLDARTGAPNIDRMDAEWGIVKIKADSVWQMGFEGEGVVVAGQDTGYDFDNGLILSKYRGYTDAMNIDHNFNWHDAIDSLNPLNNDTIYDPSLNPCGFLSDFPCDDHGHGSHTMGTMVGSDTANAIGVAPAAQWIGCRNMDRGWGMPSTYTECFEWFLAPTDLEGQNPDPNKAPHVINNSWGCPPKEGCEPENWTFMETVIDNLTAAGTVVVVSAGNDGGDGCSSIRNPAAIFENSFSVGATRDNDTKPGFSSIGPVMVDSSGRLKPDVVAPGFDVRSIWLNDEFKLARGTSMAGPHVAGAVALIISANPDLAGQVDEIKNILKMTAVPLVDSTECAELSALEVPNFYYGYGRIDALAAVNMALSITSVSEIEEEAFVNVYPNPNNGEFIIEMGDRSEMGEVYIRDLTGKLITRFNPLPGRDQIVVRDLSTGVYIYTVVKDDRVYSGKVVVGK